MEINLLNGKVRVYNYSQSPIGFPSNHSANGVFIRGRDEEEEFVVERVDWDDIESENTKSDIFKVGRLRFHPDEEDEIYNKLGIEDRENIKTDKELIGILKDSSVENIKWISNLKSSTLLLRLKNLLFRLERSGDFPPPTVSAVVNERVNEIKFGLKRDKNSSINKILEADKQKREKDQVATQLEELAKKVEQLEKEKSEKDQLLNQSESAIQLLLQKVEELTKADTPKEPKPNKNDTAKKSGRPPKNK